MDDSLTKSPHEVNNNEKPEALDEACPPDVRLRLRRTSSCQALRHALLTLYRLDDFSMCKIGSGFFSEVFMVTHKVSGQIMVLKMNTSEDNRPNMLREVQLMNRMSHPNILKFLGVCVHEGQLHALTEYIRGGSLHDILCDDTTTQVLWNDRVQIAIDVSSGMEYLHSKGIFHRDLTSRNILIDNLISDGISKRAVVADFGLATKIPDPSREFHLSVVGSPYWISPECIIGQPYNETTDIFSFGIVLCETIARIDADPDVLPRTQNFGLDYVAYSELLEECPLHFLYLAFQCCQMEPKKRPPFAELSKSLKEIKGTHLSQFEKTVLVPHLLPSGNMTLQQFNQRASLYNQRSCSEQSLDFLKEADDFKCMSPTAKVIGNYMTKEDPLYEPAPANTNPFASNAQLSTGKKLVASDTEREQVFELSTTLPLASQKQSTEENNNSISRKRSVMKISHSLPDNHGVVQRAIAQFNAQISNGQNQRNSSLSPMEKLLSSDYASAEESVDGSFTSSLDFARQNSKQRNLECAMLFCGLDLIQMQRASSSEWSDTHISTDLESEFHDDLEDVLRQSNWDSEDLTLSPSADSAFSDVDTEWWISAEQADPAACRYLHPTLVEKRKQLRRVESRQKEKIELLQIKLEQLKITAYKTFRMSRKQSNR